MRKLLTWIVLAPLVLVVLVLAIANRRPVVVSLDPFSLDAPAWALSLPLFLVMFAALLLGVLIGGTAVWFGKLRWKMAAQRAEREAARLRDEIVSAEERARAAALADVRGLPPRDRAAG